MEKKAYTVLGATVGAGVGGVAGYLNTEDKKEKLFNTLAGAATGGVLGGFYGKSVGDIRRKAKAARQASDNARRASDDAFNSWQDDFNKRRQKSSDDFNSWQDDFNKKRQKSNQDWDDIFEKMFGGSKGRRSGAGAGSGSGKRSYGYSGGSFRSPGSSHEEASKFFGVSSMKTKADVKAAMRKAALKNHPDRGGTEAAMKEVNKHKDSMEKSTWFQKLARLKMNNDFIKGFEKTAYDYAQEISDLEDDRNETAKKKAMGLFNSLAGGGVLGGGLGAMLGAGAGGGSSKVMALGGLVGGALGAGIGGLVREIDKDDIEDAKKVVGMTPEKRRVLLASRARKQEQEEHAYNSRNVIMI